MAAPIDTPTKHQLGAQVQAVGQAQHVCGQHAEVERAELGELGLAMAPGVGGQDGGAPAADLGAGHPPQLLQVAPEPVQQDDGARHPGPAWRR